MIARIRPEASLLDAVRSVAAQDGYGAALEKELAEFFRVRAARPFQTARAALFHLLSALPQRKVYMPAYTCWVVPEAAVLAGKEVAYVDIRLGDYNLDVAQLRSELQPGSIVLATHQFGIPCDLEELVELARERDCVLIEDNAASFGSEYPGRRTGGFGAAAVLSFEYSKTLVAGRGGAALFNDEMLLARVSALREEFRRAPRAAHALRHLATLSAYTLATYPFYYRAIHALFSMKEGETTGRPSAFARAPSDMYLEELDPARQKLAYLNLRKIDRVIARKKQIAAFYQERLSSQPGLRLPEFPPDRTPVYIRFPIRVEDKSGFYRRCVSTGLDLAFTFSYVCPQDAGRFPVSKRAAETVLNLPIYSHLTDSELERIAAIVERAVRA